LTISVIFKNNQIFIPKQTTSNKKQKNNKARREEDPIGLGRGSEEEGDFTNN
jgi:hypothetical protein